MRLALHLSLLLLLPAGFAGWTGWKSWRREQLIANERAAENALRSIVWIQRELRDRDLDANGIPDYWTADVAGLLDFATRSQAGFPAEISAADPTRPGARPYRGYWFVAIVRDDAGLPYGPQSPHGFGFCAYPADYGFTGRNTYIVNDERSPTRRDLLGAPIEQWPSKSDMQNVWPGCISG